MGYEIEQVQVDEQPTAVVRGLVPMEGIAEFLGSAFGEVMSVVAAQGGSVVGPPFGCYEPTPAGFKVEAGFPVGEAVVAEGRVEASVLPGGPAVTVLHRGAYGEVAGAYHAAEQWAAQNDWESTGVPWEAYLDEPDVPEPRTLVYWPARPR